MKKQTTKKTTNLEKEKQTVKKKNQKTIPQEESKTIEELADPSWTTPEHLSEEDHRALKKFYELYCEKEFDVALDFASNLDTIVREEIPSEIWKEIGGKLTRYGEEELKSNNGMEGVKPVQEEEYTNTEQFVYPSWTTPEGLTEEDHNALKKFYDLYISGKIISAFRFASNFDSSVMEAIPYEILAEAQLIPSNEKKVIPKVEAELQKNEQEEIKNNHPSQDDDTTSEAESIEIKFDSDEELEQLVIAKKESFFGRNSILFYDNNEFRVELLPHMFLIDFTNPEKPKLFLIEVSLFEQNYGRAFVHITHFFALMRNKKNHEELIRRLNEIIDTNEELKEELLAYIPQGMEITLFLATLLDNRPYVILATNGAKSEIPLFVETYTETWGKMFFTLIIKRYKNNGEDTFPIDSGFADRRYEKGKKEEVKLTENDHLCELPDRIRKIYNNIKTALLETDSSLEFNAKKHYISVRKNKNLAFLHLRRKNVDIVVMNPEESTKGLIKHHQIKTLPASVQKFWNGECCTIVVENSDNLDEVIEILKEIIEKSR